MYSSIVNNTFSYLLTLDDFRKKFNDDFKPSWVKLTTITMVSSFSKSLNIKKIREVFEKSPIRLHRNTVDNKPIIWSLKPTTFYNQITLTYEDCYSVKSIKIFPNGNGITANRVVLNGMNSTKKDKAKVVISYTKY